MTARGVEVPATPRAIVRVQSAPLDIAAEQQALCAGRCDSGALVSFVGRVRERSQGVGVRRLTLEHYPGMAERVMHALADEAIGRWSLAGVALVHRVGTLSPGEPIVFIGVASVQRGAAFRACEFLIDRLKQDAPFWKQENTGLGERWVR